MSPTSQGLSDGEEEPNQNARFPENCLLSSQDKSNWC